MYHAYQMATVITNCLFLVNFAVNFVLYCVVNVQFRRTARDVICCACSSLGAPRHRGMAYRGPATQTNGVPRTPDIEEWRTED